MTVVFEVKALTGKMQELYQTLQALLPTMRKEKGCQGCRVSRDMEDGDVFMLSSEWELSESFENYMQSASGSILLGAIDLLGESARIRTSGDDRWEDIDAFKRKRREARADRING